MLWLTKLLAYKLFIRCQSTLRNAMRPDDARLLAAINRSFAEANNAILKLTAYNRLNEAEFSYMGTSFFVIAQQALYNDMIASAIRIFDDHKEAGSLWYIIRCNQSAAKKAATACGINIDDLKAIVPKLRHIRDKTHFHIDKRSVENPSLVWRDADISGQEFTTVLHNAARLLAKIKQDVFGAEMDQLTPYDGSDVRHIIDAYAGAKRQ
jgi:hypothetical protein